MTKKKNPEDLEKVGRKEDITPGIADRMLGLFRMGLNDEQVCDTLEITPSVLYRYQNNHPDFKEKKDLAKNHLVARAKREIYAALSSDDPKIRIDTAKWIAERKAKNEFSTRQEVTGADGESLIPKIEILPVAVIDKNDENVN